MNYDVVQFTNITGEDFTCHYDKEPYTIKAGETKPYPKFLAVHFAGHLVDRIIMLDNPQQLNDDTRRAELREEILGDTVVEAQKSEEVSEGQRVKQEVEAIQKGVNKEEKVEPFAELNEEENVPEEIGERDKMKREVLSELSWPELQKKGAQAGAYKAGMGKAELIDALMNL